MRVWRKVAAQVLLAARGPSEEPGRRGGRPRARKPKVLLRSNFGPHPSPLALVQHARQPRHLPMPAEHRGVGSSSGNPRSTKKTKSVLYSAGGSAAQRERPPWGQGARPIRVPGATVTTRPGGPTHAHAVWEQIARSEAEKEVQAGWVSDAVRRAVGAHSKTQPRPQSRPQTATGTSRPRIVSQQQQRRGAPTRAPGSRPASAPRLRKTPGIDLDSDSVTSSSSSSSEDECRCRDQDQNQAMSDDSDAESARSRQRGARAEPRTAVARPTKQVTIVTRVENRDPDARVRALTRAPPPPLPPAMLQSR